MADSKVADSTPAIDTYAGLRTRLTDLGHWSSTPLTWFSSRWLYEGEQRLDANYYASDVMRASRTVKESGFAVLPLAAVVEHVFYLDRFKRIYATTEIEGKPFLTPSEMLHFQPQSDKYLAYSSGNVEECLVQPGWLLITRSGSIGRCAIVGKSLAKFALSDDIIRVTSGIIPLGYLYAFLSSHIGQSLLVKEQYGSAIKHLEPHHIESVPVPLLPESIQQSVHAKIVRAYALRDEANELLDEANTMLHKELGLPVFDERLVPYLAPPPREDDGTPDIPHPRAFTINASELTERLDASYHIPIARTAIELMRKNEYTLTELGQMVKTIFLPSRFKRVYVDQPYGIPFLQGSHLPQMQPHDLKYISRTANQRQVKECLICPGWVLITRSGTIGRIGVTTKAQSNWAASEHMIRVVPDEEKGHRGYIAAFLMTPYGQHQLRSKIYGAVVDELTVEDTGSVLIPQAPMEVQQAIGDKVVLAYEKKDQATAIEMAGIKELERFLTPEATLES